MFRIFEVGLAARFYLDYLGCQLDWEEGDAATGPTYRQVSRGGLRLHLSSHHVDGTPGGVVVVEVRGIGDLHAELHGREYAFMRPGLEVGPGPDMRSLQVIDPFSNLIRFFERDV